MTRRWFDKWAWTDPEARCHCGHLLRRHPTERFRSCSDCVWCDDFREPPASGWERERADAVRFVDPKPGGHT